MKHGNGLFLPSATPETGVKRVLDGRYWPPLLELYQTKGLGEATGIREGKYLTVINIGTVFCYRSNDVSMSEAIMVFRSHRSVY